MSALDPRERDLVKCEDMRIHAERALIAGLEQDVEWQDDEGQ